MDNKRPETMARINTKKLADEFIAEQVAEIRNQVGDKKVLLALSGGVDSSVVAALLIKAVGANSLFAFMLIMAYSVKVSRNRLLRFSATRWTLI